MYAFWIDEHEITISKKTQKLQCNQMSEETNITLLSDEAIFT